METQNTHKNTGSKFGNWLKTSITARMLMVGFLTLILLIPLVFIEDLIRERYYRQKDVISEINLKWGNEVLLYGPILKIPYKTYQEKLITNKLANKAYTETIESIEYAYFFPEQLDINANADAQPKKRGIYQTAVYKSNIQIQGKFAKPNFSEKELNNKNILWNKAKVILKTTNLKGVSEQVSIKIDNNTFPFKSIYGGKTTTRKSYQTLHSLESNVISENEFSKANTTNFTISLNINGSKQMRFIPIGKTTTTQMQSDWKNANFFGEFSPYNANKVKENGFNAKWKILDINRPFAQQYFNYLPDLTEFAFGVEFLITVDQYLQSERSVKYGFLVIGLTFLLFFLIQTLSKIPIHPFQYLMIGLALCMFYTLLIAISEHSNFSKAYLTASFSVITLITLYSKSILKTIKFPMFIGLSLTALYAFIYTIIQLENYALLVGSIGLFLILAIIMFISRKIDWHS